MKGRCRLAWIACLVLATASCAGSGQAGRTVTSEVVHAATTPELRVLAPKGKGTWPVAYLLHGFGGSHDVWRDVIASLAPSACTLAYDLPGHGLSFDFAGAAQGPFLPTLRHARSNASISLVIRWAERWRP